MLCSTCASEMDRKVQEYHYIECGLENVFIPRCEMYVCPQGHPATPILPSAQIMAKEITKELLSLESPLRSDAILFLRKALGMTAAELAGQLGVHRVEISRWENARNDISPLYDFKLRLLVADRVLDHSEQREAWQNMPAVLQRYIQDAEIKRRIEVEVPIPAATYCEPVGAMV